MEEDVIKPKKPRGNPNFGRGKTNPYYGETNAENQEQMSEKNTSTEEPVVQESAAPATDISADIFSDEMPSSSDSPLDGEVKTQAYGALHEPGTANANANGGPNPNGGPTAPVDPNAPNPGANAPSGPPMTPAETQTNAEQLVNLAIKGYEKLHGLGRWAGKMDQGELSQQHIAGKIDLNQELPLGKKTITVGGFFAEYNASIDETIVVTEEFKTQIKPPLVRIAIKRGWGLGDEASVIMMVAEDLATKVSMLIGLKKSATLVLEACQQMMKKKDGGGGNETTSEPAAGETNKPGDDSVPFVDLKDDGADSWHKETTG